jgi:hypothetical protein
VDAALVEACLDSGIPLGVYTVDRKREMKHLAEMGVHAIFTNFPDRLKEVLSSLRVDSEYPPIEDVADFSHDGDRGD